MKEQAFYKQPILTWFLLFVFPPFGIMALWILRQYELIWRIMLTFLFGLVYLEFLGFYSSAIRAFLIALILIYILWRRNKIKEYEAIITNQFNEARKNTDIQTVMMSFLSKFPSPTHCFNDYLAFEAYLQNHAPIIYRHLRLSHKEDLWINFIYHESSLLNTDEDESNETEHYFELFNDLTTLIKKKYPLGGDKYTLYFSWELLKQISIDYYSEQFEKNYGHEFNDVNMNKLNDILLRYVSIDAFHTHINSSDLAMLTYFLMKKNIIEPIHDFPLCLVQVEKEIKKQVERRKFNLFEKQIHLTKSEIIKEVEHIELINQMKTKERFMIFIEDLFKALDYQVIEKPFNHYLDFIVSIKEERYGITCYYKTNLKEHVSLKALQDIKLGLTYNGIKKGILITNGTFQGDYQKFSERNEIMLWDEVVLKEKIALVKRYPERTPRSEPTNEIKIGDILKEPFEKINLSDINLMNGHEFEYYLTELFKRKGYKLERILKSHDKGIDIILEKNSLRIGIQAKRHQSPIGIDAIKEIISGLPYYNLHQGYVITNSTFTKEAKILADCCQINLWDEEKLKEELKKIT